MSRSRLSVVALVLFGCVGTDAQEQAALRTSANYVRVDMYATVDGRRVADLRSDEVVVLEDGVSQSVEAFEYVSVPSAAAQPLRSEAPDDRTRVFVVFLDTYHTAIESSTSARLPLIRFLDRLLGPDDMVALMTPETEVSELTFGRKTGAISSVMQAEWTWGRRGRLRLSEGDPKDALYEACYGNAVDGQSVASQMKARRREKLTLDALEELVTHLGGVQEGRKAVIAVTEGWQLFRSNSGLAAGVRERRPSPGDVLRRRPSPPPTDSDGLSGSTRVECEADRTALAMLDHTQRLLEVSEEANRGNVTFYPVYARGLVASEPSIEAPSAPEEGGADPRVRQDALRFLADNTDGTAVIGTQDVDSALQRIVDDLSAYYLIGYHSTNTKLDGRFRTITVRVNRPGVRVRARRGYRGRTPEGLVASAAVPSAAGDAAALSAALTPVAGFTGRAPFRIRAASWMSPTPEGSSTGAVWIVGELDYRTRRELVWTAGAEAEVVVVSADGTEVMSRTIDVRLEDGPFGVELSESGGLPAGEYAVRVRLESDADGALALSDTARVVLGEQSPLGEAVLLRRGPTTGPRYQLTADPRFRRSERLRLELPSATMDGAVARLIDRNGNTLAVPVQVSQRVDTARVFRWVVLDVALAPFAPGDYAVEVRQGSATRVTGFRIVP